MKKIFSILAVTLVSLAMWADKLYLKSGAVDYAADDAVVAIWSWGGSSSDAWYVFQESEVNGIYYVTLPSGRTGGKIIRWPKGTTPSWDVENKAYNKTGDIPFPSTYPATTDMIELTEWDNATTGTWTKFVVPVNPDYYMKNNWDGGDWTWKEMTKDGDNFKLENVVFGGSGVNYNTAESDTGAEWVAVGDFKGASINEFDTVNLVLDPSANTVTATLVHACVRMDVKLVPGVWKTADNPKFAAWMWNKNLSGRFTSFFTPIKADNDTLHVSVIGAMDSLIFVRFADTTSYPRWNNGDDKVVWNEAEKTLIDKTGLTYSITGWGEGENAKSTGTWEEYIPEIPAKYYISGDSALVVDAGLDASKKWNADAIKSTEDSYKLSLKAGVDYKLRVSIDGTWDNPDTNSKGYKELTTPVTDGLYKDNDNNICFRLNTAGDVTVTYTASLFKLEGNFYVKPVELKTVQFVPSEEWLDANAKFAAWTWGEGMEAEWSAFFTPKSAGNDTLVATIKETADSIDFVRFSPKAKVPTWEKQGEYVVVWNELKDTIDWAGLTASVDGWNTLSWKPVERSPESFGLLINDVYKAGKKNVTQSWREYMLLNVELHEGDRLQVRDNYRDANWVIETYMENSYHFNISDGKYVVDKDGVYDFYLKLVDSANEIFISKAGFSTKSVPDACEDVLMQAFFNESYSDDAPGVGTTGTYPYGIGNTRWNTLVSDAEDIRRYFDLVWLPPSANGEGMGYHPKNYGNQNSVWGSSSELDNLIKTLHGPDANKIQARVVADIVINHCQSSTGWMGFPEFDFGKYGKYKPVGEWVCSNDEVNSDPKSDAKGQATGPIDDGDNWSGARDWAHSNVEVQNMFKAYLQWMREVIGYDGFRYDKGDGFNNWHHDNYNKNAGPYIAFMECYSNTDEIQWRIGQANNNLMALDFDTKWHVFDQIAGFKYPGRGNGLLGRGAYHYAITFIDSHDWFLRPDNENEFGGRGNSLTPALKDRLLQANAFLLSMPGIPCVFYPHWKTYKNEIKEMIEARKWAGVHSDSQISDESVSYNDAGYQATIHGKYGYLILQLGDKTTHSKEGHSWLDAYELKASGPGYAMWVNRTSPQPAEEYYLVGSKYNWSTADERLFYSSGTEGEFVLKGINFEQGDIIKVVKVVNNKFKAWYPGEDYVISSSEAGKMDIYFRPETYEPWGGNIHIVASGTPTSVEEVDNKPAVKAEKFMRDGKLYIRMGDKVYDMLGQTIK